MESGWYEQSYGNGWLKFENPVRIMRSIKFSSRDQKVCATLINIIIEGAMLSFHSLYYGTWKNVKWKWLNLVIKIQHQFVLTQKSIIELQLNALHSFVFAPNWKRVGLGFTSFGWLRKISLKYHHSTICNLSRVKPQPKWLKLQFCVVGTIFIG